MNEYLEYLVKWIRDKVTASGAKGVVIGVSGGIDSALVAYLGKKAFPNNSIGVIMPIGNMHDIDDAQNVAKYLSIDTHVINLTTTYKTLIKELPKISKLSDANIKPRIRMTTLYSIAQTNNYFVLGTDNAAEWALGYFTKFGDGGVDILPIIHLTKSQVRDAAKLVKIPSEIISKPPSAGLWEGQTDEDEMGFTYEMIDKYLLNQEIPKNIKKRIERQIKKTEHKRIGPPQPKKISN